LRETAATIASRLEAERLWPEAAAAQPGEARTPPSDDQRPRSRIPAYVER